jgi:hypothetical protein
MIELFSLAPPVLIGWLAIRLGGAATGLRPRWAAHVAAVSLGAGAGVAVTSSIFVLLLRAGIGSSATLLAVELALLAALVLAQRRRLRPPDSEAPEPPPFRWNGVLIAAACAALVLLVATQVSTVRASPHGNWDAFAIWNVRAKFLLAPGDLWKNALSPLLERTHPEYPLLLSAFIARTWRLAGVTSLVAPLATAFLFAAGVLALLFSLLAISRGLAAALLACFVFFATASYIEQIPWQYADIPLSFYMLATLGCVLLGALGRARARPAFVLAGLFASFAALTKNEGTAFLLAGFCCFVAFLTLRQARWWLLGALPGVLLLADFRLLLAPPVDLLRGQTIGQLLAKLADPGRYSAVAGALFQEAVSLGDAWSHPLILLALLAATLRWEPDVRYRLMLRFGGAALGAMLLVYCGVYLVTPEDLAWLLGTSLGRLYVHLWPSFLLLAFLVLGRLEDPPPPKVPSPHKKKRR